MKLNLILLSVVTILSFSALASTQDEINHLLNFVSITECKYERNSEFHNGIEAEKHINKKYKHYVNDIKTAEDFIKYSATQSMMSGTQYIIHCKNEKPIKSKDWLLIELQAYRNNQN